MNYSQLINLIMYTFSFCKFKIDDNVIKMIAETACVETNCGQYIKQINGPACGIFQIEPRTAQDIINNFIKRKDNLHENYARLYNGYLSLEHNLQTNLMFSIFMCRCFYMRIKEPIPNTIEGRAKYWKKYYNTELGKGTVENYIKAVDKFAK